MKLIFLLEERSMKELLDIILPKILPPSIVFQTIPHSGKSDLQSSIPKKLRAWNEPDVKFVIVQDQDSADCVTLKNNLYRLCIASGRTVLIRIACKDLESLSLKSKYRIPDKIENPKNELKKLLPCHQQILGARLIGPLMDIEQNTSQSFQYLISGLNRLGQE